MLELNQHYYNTIPNNLWTGRSDSLPNERFFQNIDTYNLQQQPIADVKESVCLMGFASDEGVRRNLGRPGAKDGPNAIRQQLAKLACHKQIHLADLGNICCPDDNLELAQHQLIQIVDLCHSQNKKTIILGGGHEVAWPHFKGLSSHYPKVGIINFDAHFDLRPLLNGTKSTSGTGFRQMADYCQSQNYPFTYCCLGIQPQANTAQLFQTAEALGVTFMTASEMHENTTAWQTAFIDEFILNHHFLYLTLCLDVLAEAFAPGVSAPQATGISPWQMQPLLKYILQTGKVVALDIAELSPPLDQDDKTARLAAVLLADLIRYF
jgi:formiminoglutamase